MEEVMSTVEIGHDEELYARGGANANERDGHWPGLRVDTDASAEDLAVAMQTDERIHLCWMCQGDGCLMCANTGKVTAEQMLNALIDADIEDIYDQPESQGEDLEDFEPEFESSADFERDMYQPDLDQYPSHYSRD